MDQTLLIDIHGEGPADVCVTDLLTPVILKSDVLPALRPHDAPSSLLHTGDKLFTAGAVLKRLDNRDGTVCHKTLLCLACEEIVFILAPSADLSVFDPGPVEVFSLLRE